MAEGTKRTRRTKEEMIKAVKAKVEAENKRHIDALCKLNNELERLEGSGLTKLQKQKIVNDAIKKSGLTPEELAKKLKLDVKF